MQTMSLLAGVLPFGAAFIELYYVLSSLFASRAYYAFGFVTLTATVFGLTTAMVAILFTYFTLCAEEYRWHWRAFLAGGGSAAWLLLYGLYYSVTRLSLDSASSVALYFGYLFLLALLDFLITGACPRTHVFCRLIVLGGRYDWVLSYVFCGAEVVLVDSNRLDRVCSRTRCRDLFQQWSMILEWNMVTKNLQGLSGVKEGARARERGGRGVRTPEAA
jgi:hypothetical protein